jgi:Electron transfer DM13
MQKTSDPPRSLVRRARSRLRWYEFAPEVVLAVGLGLFAVTEPHAAGAAFKSTKAVGIMVIVGLGWVLLRAATLLFVRLPAIRLAVFAAAALAVLKVVVLPAYNDHTVIEALPVRSADPAVVSSGGPVATMDPVKIGAGMLRGIDHRASGVVHLYRQVDGHVVIGLEDFDIQPGPAYVLYLVAGNDRRDHDGGTRIERLRGNRGTQFYAAPEELDVSGDGWTVLVWCETFDVPVANSTPMSM